MAKKRRINWQTGKKSVNNQKHYFLKKSQKLFFSPRVAEGGAGVDCCGTLKSSVGNPESWFSNCRLTRSCTTSDEAAAPEEGDVTEDEEEDDEEDGDDEDDVDDGTSVPPETVDCLCFFLR